LSNSAWAILTASLKSSSGSFGLMTSVAVLRQEGRLDAAWDGLPAVKEEDFHAGIVAAIGGLLPPIPQVLRGRSFDKMSRRSPKSRRVKEMPTPLPNTLDQWLKEIVVAIKDAREAKLFVQPTETKLTDANLFHLAPLVCLKFRGRKLTGAEADRVTKGALANYVSKTGPESPVQGLESQPQLAFALCYVAAHLVLDLVDEQTAGEIMDYCEEHLPV
jgi:hypothetical protein